MLTIKQLRDKIDKIDEDIIKKLSQRKKLSIKIGKIKSTHDKKVFDSKREKNQILRYKKLSLEHKLQSTFIKKLFKMIIANSRELQK